MFAPSAGIRLLALGRTGLALRRAGWSRTTPPSACAAALRERLFRELGAITIAARRLLERRRACYSA